MNPIAITQMENQFWAWLDSYTESTNGWINNEENLVGGKYNRTNLGNTYCQALYVIALLYRNSTISSYKAQNILDELVSKNSSNFNGMYNGLFTTSGLPDTNSDRYLANNAWVLLALCHFEANNVGSFRYKVFADILADWIVSFQDITGSKYAYYNDGGLYSGYDPSGNLILASNKVQECQVLAIAALRAHSNYYNGRYSNVATQVQGFLLDTVSGLRRTNSPFYAGKWNTPKGSAPGFDTSNVYFDNAAWAALMAPTVSVFSLSSSILSITLPMLSYHYGKLANGFADRVGNTRIFVEAWAYLHLVYYKSAISSPRNYSNLLNYEDLLIESKGFAGCGVPVVTNNPSYTGQDISIAAEPVLWYLLAVMFVNPFDPSQFTKQQFTDIANPFQL